MQVNFDNNSRYSNLEQRFIVEMRNSGLYTSPDQTSIHEPDFAHMSVFAIVYYFIKKTAMIKIF